MTSNDMDMRAPRLGCRGPAAGTARPPQGGFTLVEMVIVMLLIGVIAGIALPMLRTSTTRRVEWAANQLVSDLELARTRSLSTKKAVRVVLDEAASTYVGYLDDDGDSTFAESFAETQALRGFGTRTLEADVRFGRGSAPPAPGDTGSGAITLSNSRAEFDSRGITVPFGERGAVYFVHRDDPNAVAAVSVTGSASFKLWVYRQGEWR